MHSLTPVCVHQMAEHVACLAFPCEGHPGHTADAETGIPKPVAHSSRFTHPPLVIGIVTVWLWPCTSPERSISFAPIRSSEVSPMVRDSTCMASNTGTVQGQSHNREVRIYNSLFARTRDFVFWSKSAHQKRGRGSSTVPGSSGQPMHPVQDQTCFCSTSWVTVVRRKGAQASGFLTVPHPMLVRSYRVGLPS